MKTYSVLYTVKTSYEAVVKANSKEEAKEKVAEVIGDPLEFEHVYEVKSHASK